MFLSIIIPVYNVEKYIRRCIESCLNQDIPKSDYEIIVVDDGTPDKSCAIVEALAQANSNITLIHQNNAGQSSARNNGLKKAKGDYIWFVDSDDYIYPNCLGIFKSKCYSEHLDIMPFSISFQHNEKEPEPCNLKLSDKPINGKIYMTTGWTFVQPWAAIYLKQFLLDNNIWFYEGIIHEDQEWTPRTYYLAEKVAYCETLGYVYYQHRGTTSTEFDKQKALWRADCLIKANDSLWTFITSRQSEHDEVWYKFINCISSNTLQAIGLSAFNNSNDKEIKQKPYYPLHIPNNISFKNKLLYLLANCSIRLYKWVYRNTKHYELEF